MKVWGNDKFSKLSVSNYHKYTDKIFLKMRKGRRIRRRDVLIYWG